MFFAKSRPKMSAKMVFGDVSHNVFEVLLSTIALVQIAIACSKVLANDAPRGDFLVVFGENCEVARGGIIQI